MKRLKVKCHPAYSGHIHLFKVSLMLQNTLMYMHKHFLFFQHLAFKDQKLIKFTKKFTKKLVDTDSGLEFTVVKIVSHYAHMKNQTNLLNRLGENGQNMLKFGEKCCKNSF